MTDRYCRTCQANTTAAPDTCDGGGSFCETCGTYYAPVCCICGGPLLFWGLNPDSPYGYGNNPDPLGDDEEDRCCGTCNDTKVIPARLQRLTRGLRRNREEDL